MHAAAAAIMWAFLTVAQATGAPADQRDLYDATHVAGTIAVINGSSSFQMSSGLVVFMHRGTVINPRGIKLRACFRLHGTCSDPFVKLAAKGHNRSVRLRRAAHR